MLAGMKSRLPSGRSAGVALAPTDVDADCGFSARL